MESAPKTWRLRFNEMADNGTLLVNLLFVAVLFGPPAFLWLKLGLPDDLLGYVAVIAYGSFAVAAFKGLVRGDWN